MINTLIKLLIFSSAFVTISTSAQTTESYWHNTERTVRYQPENGDYVITNGTRRFNRALYGTNTAFRVETGDLPEFAMYLPGMGGNLKLGLIKNDKSKWLISANTITARYCAGSMIYDIKDSILENGTLHLTVLALSESEGLIIKIEGENIPSNLQLCWAYGGLTGKKFSRDGDMNIDPESSFYLKPENCINNNFEIIDNRFVLLNSGVKKIAGQFPTNSTLQISDAKQLETPLTVSNAESSINPVIFGKIALDEKDTQYIKLNVFNANSTSTNENLVADFDKAEKARLALANRIKLNTPDAYINNLGAAIGIAGDAIWENPTFMHGAIGWRIRLNGWRGPYAGDALGWHDRARTHFNAYAQSQIITPESGPSVPDESKNLARQEEKIGNSMFTSGYICRNPEGKFTPHHYDMNLVFVDALIRHLYWTGDTAYARQMWPLLTRHLAWEKRNFDADNDGLYDAYCCIWASDALQYSGGGVTHSSSYNYLANKTAARIATLIGENGEVYQKEADKILKAINSNLWLSKNGWYAEFQEFLQPKRIHSSAALWTVYHTLDSEVPDMFKAYQTTRYIDNYIPHIPVKATNLKDTDLHVLSTTNWMPYEWSINNVVPAENMHTALAYWQAGRPNEAFHLWRSTIMDAQYLGGSPGNFLQISFYDANRGEVYRDFADAVGMSARSLVEGLFGFNPNLLNDTISIRPGLPTDWNFASIATPDFSFDFKREKSVDSYTISHNLNKTSTLNFKAIPQNSNITKVMVNGKKVAWKPVTSSIGYPQIEINIPNAQSKIVYKIEIQTSGEQIHIHDSTIQLTTTEPLNHSFVVDEVEEVYDPQKVLKSFQIKSKSINAVLNDEAGFKTFFVKVKNNDLTWWLPLNLEILNPIEVKADKNQPENALSFFIQNNAKTSISGDIQVNGYQKSITINGGEVSPEILVSSEYLIPGSNLVEIKMNNQTIRKTVINWNIQPKKKSYETVDFEPLFNDKVSQIYKNEYLSPRCPYPTLSLPKQGFGDWCYPTTYPNIDDSGLRKLAGTENQITIPQGIPFKTPSDTLKKNILFTSKWDNFPEQISIPLSGNASHAYFLMAGSTYHMQSQITNGVIEINYTDGTMDSLVLRNPESWWPIERDYYSDGYAFNLKAPLPIRVYLKTGVITNNPDSNFYYKIKGIASNAIDGGAATVFDIPLDASKILKNVILRTEAPEVIIGLMSVTLQRE